MDANDDGIADPYDLEDAVYSAANFLSKAGVAKGELKKLSINIIIVKNMWKIFYFIISNIVHIARS